MAKIKWKMKNRKDSAFIIKNSEFIQIYEDDVRTGSILFSSFVCMENVFQLSGF